MGEIAILMAAGLGSRMRPLTDKIPKPLAKVHGKELIQTMIDGLGIREIDDIYIVTGYLSEQFQYLRERDTRIHLIYNENYNKMNNIGSIYAAIDFLGEKDCFICESDIWVKDRSVFETNIGQSCYFGVMRTGYTDDWVFDTNDLGRITSIHKGGTDKFNMTGVCYLKKEDASLLKMAIQEEVEGDNRSQLFWDEIMDRLTDDIDIRIHEIREGQLIEIDTLEELDKANEGR